MQIETLILRNLMLNEDYTRTVIPHLKLIYLPLIITQSIRGAGYFNGGFLLIVFIMLFTYINISKNK